MCNESYRRRELEKLVRVFSQLRLPVRFPGNPTQSYRSRSPLRITGEVAEWQGHSPEQLQAMKDGIARLEAQGGNHIID